MRKLIISIFVTFISLLCYAQATSGVWNSSTSTYTNTNHGIKWSLIDGDWIGRPILAGGTFFKVRNDELQIMVSLGARSFSGEVEDIWDSLPSYSSQEVYNMQKALADHNNMVLKSVKPVKSQVSGKHAIRIKVDMARYYPEYNITGHGLTYTYELIVGKYVYSIGITCLSVLEDDLDTYERIVGQLISGFSID